MLLLFACAPSGLDIVPADTEPLDTAVEHAGGTTEDSNGLTGDSGGDSDSVGVVVESIGDQPDGADDWIFSRDYIHTIEITLDETAWTALTNDPYTSAHGSFRMDGEALADVGVRLRGKIGSFRTLGGKPKFVVDFNEWVSDQRFYGLEALNLNNSVVDCSYMKETIGYDVFAMAGVPSLRTAYARVYVNGSDYGLYVILEEPDDRFLARHYADNSGNLYDGKYIWYGGYSYTLLDFQSSVDYLYQLEEGTDVANADIHGITTVVESYGYTADYYPQINSVVDFGQFHRVLAMEQWVGHNDGYALNTNNYRVYFDPTDGLADVLPWDLDYSFLNDSDWGMSWYYPRGVLASRCWADGNCVFGQKNAVASVLSSIDTHELLERFDAMNALTYADTQNDPRRECDPSYVSYYRSYVRSWIETRGSYMKSFWGL